MEKNKSPRFSDLFIPFLRCDSKYILSLPQNLDNSEDGILKVFRIIYQNLTIKKGTGFKRTFFLIKPNPAVPRVNCWTFFEQKN
ncbi:hypothetical protein DO021_20550 [Desulfobacter hydrogenophilus]|uniref:Uncharacterized protein n=1 Tax=Desulfobacter hydrogenophilus TaxID=2291 RepID=A0A328F6I4_9BACT|nr:hypothetical protein DO021_20550 [Desulfobacter hydrogenophilus]